MHLINISERSNETTISVVLPGLLTLGLFIPKNSQPFDLHKKLFLTKNIEYPGKKELTLDINSPIFLYKNCSYLGPENIDPAKRLSNHSTQAVQDSCIAEKGED